MSTTYRLATTPSDVMLVLTNAGVEPVTFTAISPAALEEHKVIPLRRRPPSTRFEHA